MLEVALARGQPPPSWLEEEPPAYPGDEFYLKAWHALDSCRIIGLSMGPIPWRDVVSYAQYTELEPDVTEAFVEIIRTMDRAYLKWCEKKSPKPGRKKHG